MTWGNRVGYVLYGMALFMIILGILSIPVVYKAIGMAVGDTSLLIDMSGVIKSYINLYLAFFMTCLAGFLVERVVGFGDWTLLEIKSDWKNMPLYFKTPLLIMMVVILFFDLESLLLYGWGLNGVLGNGLAGWEVGWSPLSRLNLEGPPLSFMNFIFFCLLVAAIIVAHINAPTWRRIRGGGQLDGKRTIGPATQRLDARDLKSLRKAEQYMEKGKYIKAAVEFEKLGNEFHYRAARLYMEKGQDDKASKAFLAAGDYFLSKNNLSRAGDAYFFGEHWEQAAGAYGRCTALALGNDPERIKDWISRWCTALGYLGRYRDAAERYSEHGMHAKAGEAFERAGMHTQAAQSYGRAGAYDSSAKVLADGGFDDLALMEQGKLYLQQEEFLAAAEAFEKGKHHAEAAEAYNRAGIPLKAARSYMAAGRPDIAVEHFLAAGEEEKAMECYEQMGEYVSAARMAAHLGIQDKQAIFFRKGGMMVAAARSYLMIGQLSDAVSCLQEVTLDNRKVVNETAQILAILFEQNRFRESMACCYGLLEGKTPSRLLAPLLFNLARTHRKLGNMEKAYRYGTLVARLDPRNDHYREEARVISERMGDRAPGTEAAKPVGNVDVNMTNQLSPTMVGQSAQQSVSEPAKPSIKLPVSFAEPDSGAEETTQTLDENSVYDLTIEGELQRYQVIKELGKGGMGFVYKAMDNKLKRFVALKMLHPEHNHDPRVVLFFKREARAIAKLNHPNIVQLFDMGKEHGTFYMVMEYVKGHTLKSLSERYPDFMRRNLIPIWYQACSGLRYAHQNGILHRDLKPSNLMWSQERRVKILDFGLAKEVEDMNKTAQLWGTPSFMPPEMFQGERATYASDIYGLGATFYMLATRRAPFSDEDTARKFSGKGLPIAPKDINPKISQHLSDTIQGCLYLNPAERFQDMSALMKRLKQISRKQK